MSESGDVEEPVPLHKPAFRALVRSLVIAALAVGVATPSAHALDLGFNDLDMQRYAGWFSGPADPAALNAGMAHSREAGANVHRFMLVWNEVASQTTTPSATEAADPSWPGYSWEKVDLEVKAIVAHGMVPVSWVARAPTWAEGPDRPAVSTLVPRGTWKPSAPALRQFAIAIGKRYSGTFPDPAAPGQTLPKMDTFQAWNEPNLYTEITPQWERSGDTWKMSSAAQYRNLATAFSAGIKSVQPAAKVLSAGTAPFGDLNPGEPRIPPALFYRELLCESVKDGKIRVRKSCAKLPIDGWAHHTYPIGPPTRSARNVDDVVVPDLGKLTVLMDAAAKAKVVSSAAAKNLWMTEMSWDSFPDPNGLSLEDHALYMQGAFYVLWKAGANTIIWWNSRDERKGDDWNVTLQSGIFRRGANETDPNQDIRKPSWTAFHFPFVAYRAKGVATLWSRAPGAGDVAVEAKTGAGWTRVATLTSRGGQVFAGRLRVGVGTELRAVQGAETSLTWTTF
ncbi:MAG: hypothetical protein Q7T55_17405 [Solirubrobacteraceae bacterium]|nr:hypothetical protein [Solirubrobacteraceae bacterium]